MANPATPRPGSVGEGMPDPAPLHAAAISLAALALAALSAAAWAWRSVAESRRREAGLRAAAQAARAETHALSRALDAWQWSTDERHRLVAFAPPPDADASAWSSLPIDHGAENRKPFLWDCVHAESHGNPRGLRARLEAHAELDLPEARFIGEARPGGAAQGEPWRLRAAPRFDHEGRFAGYVGIARPAASACPEASAALVSEAQAHAMALNQAPQGPDSAYTMTDSESFSYTVSHDLRAPIRVVEGFTKILKEDYGRQLDRVGNDHLDRVLGAAARMNSMIDALLALAQLQSAPLVRQPINLSQLAQYIVDDLRRQAPEREVVVHVEPHMEVRGDPTLLRIALENLMGNAWKYTGKRRLAQIWFEREPHENLQGFCVRDNGAGFDMRFADRLFGVFQRLHSANDFQGTGVGLASVRRIVRRHGGEIWADSEPDRGARFHFTLPR